MKKPVVCTLSVEGMHCDSCELFIEDSLKKQPGVKSVVANSETLQVTVTYETNADQAKITDSVNEIIEKRGYKIVSTLTKKEFEVKKFFYAVIIAGSLFALYLILQRFNFPALFDAETLTPMSIIFLGIIASLTSCMAVVGGLAMSLSSKLAKNDQRTAIIYFHGARIAGFVLLGGLTGLIGRAVVITGGVAIGLKVIVALLMFGIALDMVGFRLPKVVFPKVISEYFDIFTDKEGITEAVFLGFVTYFLPCAFTQSMQLYALSTGSFFEGALVMGAFSLGTLPVLALVSLGSSATVAIGKNVLWTYTMAVIIVLFSLFNLLSALGFVPSLL